MACWPIILTHILISITFIWNTGSKWFNGCCSDDKCLRLFSVKLWNNGENVKWWDGELYFYRAMVKWIWQNVADNTPMLTWLNGKMVEWLNKNFHLIIVKWSNKYGSAVQIIQRWNDEIIILTLYGRLFLGPLQRWGPILLHEFFGWYIPL